MVAKWLGLSAAILAAGTLSGCATPNYNRYNPAQTGGNQQSRQPTNQQPQANGNLNWNNQAGLQPIGNTYRPTTPGFNTTGQGTNFNNQPVNTVPTAGNITPAGYQSPAGPTPFPDPLSPGGTGTSSRTTVPPGGSPYNSYPPAPMPPSGGFLPPVR